MNAPAYRVRVAFQGEPGAFSEEAAIQLLGPGVETVARPTFESLFRAVDDGAADVLLAPLENSLAGSVTRVYDLLVKSDLVLTAETILRIEHHLIGCAGATLSGIRSVESHPMALAQCDRFLTARPPRRRVAAEDTAGSVREVLRRGDPTCAAIAGRRAAEIYCGVILEGNIEDAAENYTRFALLSCAPARDPSANKMTLVVRLAHLPGALHHALGPFARRGLNLLKIESRPIHGCPWEYRFFLDVEAAPEPDLAEAVEELRGVAQDVRVLGCYVAAHPPKAATA